jgi:hypothetical protein
MPRNEGFLDPGAGPLASFAWDLRALREKAGKVPYRVLAKRAGFCASTLSVAASGARLPSLDVTLAYVQACGGDPEAWRARWHALAAQHPPAQLGPHAQSGLNAQPGLHFAPPYDADERGEPALFGAVAPNSLSAIGPSTDHELPVVADRTSTATAGYAAVGRAAVRLESAPQTAAPSSPPTHDALNSAPRRWFRFPALRVGRVATVALTLTTAVLGLRVLSEGTGNTAATSRPPTSTSPATTAMQQADELYVLIYQFTPWRSDANDAIWDVSGCRNLSNAQSKLRAIARQRQAQVEQLAMLDVSKVPDHVQLVAALKHAWITSAQSDTAYANIAADLQTGCTSGAIRTDPNYQQADAYARAAAAAKAEAAQLWNTNADALGQLSITGGEL